MEDKYNFSLELYDNESKKLIINSGFNASTKEIIIEHLYQVIKELEQPTN